VTESGDIGALAARIAVDFPDGIAEISGYGYPDSLALCAIDSVYSLRAHYSGVQRAVASYRASRAADGANAACDSLSDLVDAIARAGGAEAAARNLFDNVQFAPGTRRRKAEALYGVSRRLAAAGISEASALRDAAGDPAYLRTIKAVWLREPGLGYASWRYVGMLAGVTGVKVDRMVIRYVQGAIGEDAGKYRIEQAVEGVAGLNGIPTHELDNAIWRLQSGRPRA